MIRRTGAHFSGSCARPLILAVIRRILRNASMTGICLFPRQSGLESVKKTHQVAWVGAGGEARTPLRATAAVSLKHPKTFGWIMALTMAQGMKRLGMPVAAVFGVAVLCLIATSWFLNRDALQKSVEAQIRAVTGLDLIIKGPIDISVFPASYVSFHDVGLKGGRTADPALHVDVLTANLRLLPLLLRRFEISDVMMLRPTIRVVRDGNGESNWTPFVETIAKTMKPGAENQVSFSEIRIQDGVLKYEDAHNNTFESLGDIDLSLAWPSISRSFAACTRARKSSIVPSSGWIAVWPPSFEPTPHGVPVSPAAATSPPRARPRCAACSSSRTTRPDLPCALRRSASADGCSRRCRRSRNARVSWLDA